MSDIVLPIKGDSLELRFMLRSLELYAKGLDDVILIGAHEDLPEWIRGVKHFECQDNLGSKSRNTGRKFALYCQTLERTIPPVFWWWADDIYLTREFDLSRHELCYDGDLETFVDLRTSLYPIAEYTRLMHRSMAAVWARFSGTPLNFAVHAPMAVDRSVLDEKMLDHVWVPKHNVAISQILGAATRADRTAPIDIVETRDLKIRGGGLETRTPIAVNGFFSSTDNFLKSRGGELLLALYPEPSRFERDNGRGILR